jgi:uncharacterized damage-inducible protein DinB
MPSKLIPWPTRSFHFDTPAGLYPELIERIRSAPLRAAAMVDGVPAAVLTQRDEDGSWSIQENIAHLADLDRLLWEPRLDQFEAGVPILLSADMDNAATHAADHNARSIDEVLAEFRRSRAAIVGRMDDKPLTYFELSARHPRLETPMRLIDLIFFKAEHDDHHLARARELLGLIS